MGRAVSVVVPAYNEQECLGPVITSLVHFLRREEDDFEVIVVDDGSTDSTPTVLRELGRELNEVRCVRIRRNVGKSAALDIGLREARGDVIVLVDADGQDEPTAIPDLLARLDDGFDLVTGRRAVRRDRPIKRVTSRLYNFVTRKVTGVPGRDFNSGLKAIRRELADTLELYGELHRYIPVLAHWSGFTVAEIDVEHHPRLAGEPKFGVARFWRGFLDLLTVKFLTTYTLRPQHLFGALGVTSGLAGSGLLLWMLVLRIQGEAVGNRPALLTGVLLVLVGVQLLAVGLLAELVVHYRGRQDPSALVVDVDVDVD